MKLLIVINGLGTGGAERSTAELLPGLAAAGVTPVIGCLQRRSEGVQDQVMAAGFDVRFVDEPGAETRTLRSRSGGFRRRVARLRSLIDEVDPDVIHTTHFESDIAGRWAARGGRAAVVSSLVNTGYDPVRRGDPSVSRVRLRAAQGIDGWTARRLTDGFHALTESVKVAAVHALRISPERVRVVPRGRDPDRLGLPGAERRARVRAALRLDSDAEVVLNVGRQEFQKGQRYLLEAVEILSPARPRLVLLIAGRRGHVSNELEQMHRTMRARDRVRFLGHRDDVPDLLAAADVFAFPSLYEGLGGSVIEAMAMGLPVVTTDLDVMREVVEEGKSAILVPPSNAPGLVTAIARVLDNPGMGASFGRRGKDIFLSRFTLTSSVEGMVDLYRSLPARAERLALRAAEGAR